MKNISYRNYNQKLWSIESGIWNRWVENGQLESVIEFDRNDHLDLMIL